MRSKLRANVEAPGKGGKRLGRKPSADDVRAQLRRLCDYPRLRGKKLQGLLTFITEEWIAGNADKLTLSYIARSLKDEEETFEEETQRWSYPKTRANLAHLRKRLRVYFETEGYGSPVIFKLNAGSYAPVIEYNNASSAMLPLEAEVSRLILRAKTAIDLRTVRSAKRALNYYLQIPLSAKNPRQAANIVFIPMAVAPIIQSAPLAIRSSVADVLTAIKKSGFEPWEAVFTSACAEACYRHQWKKALTLFELANDASQGEAKYLWWYTALLASTGRIAESIGILEEAIAHFSRTNIATRTDLALLQIIAGRFADAEEHLAASLDFTSPDNPVLVSHFAILYEAQGRLDEAAAMLRYFLNSQNLAVAARGASGQGDGALFLTGIAALVLGRAGERDAASAMLDVLLSLKEKRPASSSVEISFAQIGVGKFGDAVKSLHRAAFDEGDPIAMLFHLLPPLRHLSALPSFRDLLRKLRLSLPRIRKA
jgi:tetratricopeptide (TPR) repeat protein